MTPTQIMLNRARFYDRVCSLAKEFRTPHDDILNCVLDGLKEKAATLAYFPATRAAEIARLDKEIAKCVTTIRKRYKESRA